MTLYTSSEVMEQLILEGHSRPKVAGLVARAIERGDGVTAEGQWFFSTSDLERLRFGLMKDPHYAFFELSLLQPGVVYVDIRDVHGKKVQEFESPEGQENLVNALLAAGWEPAGAWRSDRPLPLRRASV